jgi:hypothetical protein
MEGVVDRLVCGAQLDYATAFLKVDQRRVNQILLYCQCTQVLPFGPLQDLLLWLARNGTGYSAASRSAEAITCDSCPEHDLRRWRSSARSQAG